MDVSSGTKRTMNDAWKQIEELVEGYVENARAELAARWSGWHLDLTRPELHEVVGALMARQVTLATQIALSPGIWNAHTAPVLLRSMTDAYITFAWILKDPVERSQKFVLYGLGQHKLVLEHRKEALTAEGTDPAQDPLVKASEAWLNAQRFGFLTEVNVGSWAGITVREMAEDAGCLDLYRYAYNPFSAATHNMWHHISRLNLQTCENPLHRYHSVPADLEFGVDPDYLYRAAKYLDKTFKLFDKTFAVQTGIPSALEKLRVELTRFNSPPSSAEGPPES